MPDVAVFGEKDYQQLLVIRRMVRDLDIPVEILSGPVVREPDGLALSSRNAYLSETERPIAAMLNRRLTESAQKIAAGEDIRIQEQACTKTLLQDGFSSVDYVEVRDADSLDRLSSLRLPSRLLAAARIGQTRLIDNVPIGG